MPEDAITFVPGLCDTIYGDGRALFGLTTINSRPAFYVIRGDSAWCIGSEGRVPDGAPDFADFIETFYEALDSQFGPAELDDEEDDPDLLEAGHYPWPAFDSRDGSSWFRMAWPKIRGLRFEPRPFSCGRHLLAREYAAEDRLGAWADDGGHVLERVRW